MDATEEREKFQSWLAHMDDFLEDFRASVDAETAKKLDHSLESLDAAEQSLLDRFGSLAEAQARDAAAALNLYAVYVGETIRKLGGGKWDISIDNPDDAFHGLPVLTGLGSKDRRDAPLTLVTASVDRRRPGYLRKVASALTA